MYFKKLTSLTLIFIIILMCVPIEIHSKASEKYDFSERIVYGGTALDYNGWIYFCNQEDNYKLYKRQINSDNDTYFLVYGNPTAYLNVLDDRIFFISGNSIFSMLPDGSDLRMLYTDNKTISHLYAARDCLYFLREDEVIKLTGNKYDILLKRKGIKAFLPISSEEIKLYYDNPNYDESELAGEEIYVDSNEKYITEIYDTEKNEFLTATSEVESVEYNAYSQSYMGPYVNLNNITLPLKEYMPGIFFSKNGQTCTCHKIPDLNCVDSIGVCNCMRYWPTGQKATCEVDLLGAQCFAFARLVFYKCFGFIDHSFYNPGKFYSAGRIAPGAVTESSVKELMLKANTGAHVRLTRGHSVSILTMDQDFIVVYHGNSGGDGVPYEPCIVSTRRFTWAEFASYCSAGISYVNMPVDYPMNVTVIPRQNIAGYYKLNANLNVRSEPSLSSKSLGVLPLGSFANVTEVKDNWGKITYSGKDCWIYLEYALFYTLTSINPGQNPDFLYDADKKTLRIMNQRINPELLADSFLNQRLAVYDKNGRKLSDFSNIGTGSVLKIEVGGMVLDSINVIISGDSNGNGFLDAADYLIAKRVFLGTYQCSGVYYSAADVNADGKVDAKDFLKIKKLLTGS